jgi:hypothetical protein
MKNVSDRRPRLATANRKAPAKTLVARIRLLRRAPSAMPDNFGLSDAYREILRSYRALVSRQTEPAGSWRRLVREALGFLGGQADRHISSLAEYDHRRYGPFLGVSDEGGAARTIRRAAFATPKTRALGPRTCPLTVGLALDAERLGSVGETPVGPDEFAQIWSECVGRTLMTTNVGSRANLRFYRREPVVIIPAGDGSDALETTKSALAAAFKPFFDAPGGPRPIVVFLEFEFGHKRAEPEQLELLRSLRDYVQKGKIAAPSIQQVGLTVRIGWGTKGRDSVFQTIDLASSLGIEHVSVDGVVRKDADSALSLPGLLNYLPPELVVEVLKYAEKKEVNLQPINEVDPDTVAREIWSGLNTARAMGLDLGKYGLFPLTLEECDSVVGHVQRWFRDWCAAPVFYVDQGIMSRDNVYVGKDTAKGIELWLRIVAKHKVRIVLIDTVDKSQGWKILKTNNDPKGILEAEQIAHLSKLGHELNIKVLWAGGISRDQAYDFGKLGVFGIYVTTAASEPAKVTGEYKHDRALAAEKRPTFSGIVNVKTILEGGFLVEALATGSARTRKQRATLRSQVQQAGTDPVALSRVLPDAWRSWWQI